MRTTTRILIAVALVGIASHVNAGNTGAIGTANGAPGMVPQNGIHPNVAAASPVSQPQEAPARLVRVVGVLSRDVELCWVELPLVFSLEEVGCLLLGFAPQLQMRLRRLGVASSGL